MYSRGAVNLDPPAGMSMSATRTETLKCFVAEIFAKLGVPSEAARLTAAEDLYEAELRAGESRS